MNSNTTNCPADENELRLKLAEMEKAGATLLERTQVALDFNNARTKKSAKLFASSEPNAADEELPFEDDPNTCEHDPNRCEQHPSASEPHARKFPLGREPE